MRLDILARREIGGGGSCRIGQDRELLERPPEAIALFPGISSSRSEVCRLWPCLFGWVHRYIYLRLHIKKLPTVSSREFLMGGLVVISYA